MSVERIVIEAAGRQVALSVEAPPWGWRWWTFAGFAEDPVEPRPYGGSRGLALAVLDVEGSERWLCAMERDGSIQLFTTHELFQCADQEGAAEFGAAWLTGRRAQPELPL